MTDAPVPVPATEPDGEPFVVIPTAAWAHDIETRLQGLEHAPAPQATDAPVSSGGLSPEQEERIFAALKNIDDRLTRHRTELETIKTHQNELGEYVEQQLPVTVPALSVASGPQPAVAPAPVPDQESDFL